MNKTAVSTIIGTALLGLAKRGSASTKMNSFPVRREKYHTYIILTTPISFDVDIQMEFDEDGMACTNGDEVFNQVKVIMSEVNERIIAINFNDIFQKYFEQKIYVDIVLYEDQYLNEVYDALADPAEMGYYLNIVAPGILKSISTNIQVFIKTKSFLLYGEWDEIIKSIRQENLIHQVHVRISEHGISTETDDWEINVEDGDPDSMFTEPTYELEALDESGDWDLLKQDKSRFETIRNR